MNKSKRKVAIIGFGHQGSECYESIKDDTDVTVIIDPRFANVEPKMDTKSFSGKLYVSVDDAINQNADFEVGIVCVPHNQHLATTLKLLDAGKSVIKEKPLAFKSSDARLLETYAIEKKLAVMTICQRNADPIFSKARTMLNEIGTPYSFVYRYFLMQEKTSGWRAKKEFAEGGVVLDMGYHAVDMVRKFFGSPDHVTSMLTYANSEMESEGLEDFLTANASFKKSGVVGNILLGRHYAEKQETFEILGSKGTMRIIPKKELLITNLSGSVILHAKGDKGGLSPYARQITEFIKHIDEPGYYLPHMKEHVTNVDFIEKIYQANTLQADFYEASNGLRRIQLADQPKIEMEKKMTTLSFNFNDISFDKPLNDKPAITARSLPHEVWPPNAGEAELNEIRDQRNKDIRIAGRSGPIKDFEERFLDFMEGKIKYAVSFNSGTSALLAAYFAIGIKTGDEVIGPALTYHAALSPMFLLGGKPILADIEENSRCIDPNDIEKRITEKTKAITVVHQWGHPADMDRILEIAKRHNLKVIEDCSHAHGSRYKGKLCGSMGDVAVFSLQANKMVFAGEGGILVTNNANIHDKATLLGHYRDRSKKDIIDPDLQKFWVTGFGQKLRMSALNAIVAKHSLEAFPERKEGRRKCLTYLTEQLEQFPFIQATKISSDIDMGAWYGFKPLYNPAGLYGLSREKFIRALQAEGMEIDAPSAPVLATTPLYNVNYDPLFQSTENRDMVQAQNLPVASGVEASALSLPTFYDWENDKILIDEYIDAFKKVEERVRRLVFGQASAPNVGIEL